MDRSTILFCERAEQIFLRPERQFTWDEVVSGAQVMNRDGKTRVIAAVGANTFRAFHRLDLDMEGPKDTFVKYFLSKKKILLTEMGKLSNTEELHLLSKRICNNLHTRLTNIRQDQLTSFNKLRKPVDLYLEHLVSMAEELEGLRPRLVPMLHLPIDSWILNSPGIFSEVELRALGLSRGLSYGDINEEATYRELQKLLRAKARTISGKITFHPIYYDLFWNNRFKNWGKNLFETNP